MINTDKKSNRLINEKSPYLLQHAYNPVNWYPWGQEAFDKAIGENKPILLSIGYSTCHWCHVMAHESFEDESVAQLLNRYFVAIKLDREERPDIDHLYMEFCQALTGSGGWPLTILMTPEKEPFFAGTYFPKARQYGRAGLIDILDQVRTLWLTQENDLRASAREIVSSIQARRITAHRETQPLQADENQALSVQISRPGRDEEELESLLEQAYTSLESFFDARHGGFGRAPKFPSPHTLSFLLRYAAKHPDSKALFLAEKTLDGMGQGGIYDHVGFGFSRYSTDDKWLIPHFEKMLYDNALLAITYIETYQISHRAQDAQKAQEILSYILRDMTSPDGGFYSAEDADSEGIEGKFYVWSQEEVRQVLDSELAALYCAAYDITEEGNFEGKNIPNLIKTDLQQLSLERGLEPSNLRHLLEEARETLFAAREKRIHPHKDDKILTAWNGLMIAALSKAAQAFNQKVYLRAAEKALEFVSEHLRRADGRLLARYREAQAAFPAYLDDYAYLIWGILELYTASGEPCHLRLALELQKEQTRLFQDQEGGGYYLTGSDAEELLFRPKEIYDGALPSGNSVSALNLIRLARITADPSWSNLAQEQIQACLETVRTDPTGCTGFLQALQFVLYGTQELVFAGPLTAPILPEMRRTLFSGFHPFATVLYQEGSLGNEVSWLDNYPVPKQGTLAYLCQNMSCQAPVSAPESLSALLSTT